MDLCIDGNISQTFGPEGATQYFARLLRMDPRSIRITGSQEWARAFFITNPVVQNGPPSVRIDERPAWLLDYAIQDVGTVVPQHIWSAPNASDAKRYGNVPLNMPIFFVHKNRVNLGLPLLRAAAGNCMTLLSVGAAAPVGDGSTTYIRINVSIFHVVHPIKLSALKWPGYIDWSTQIMLKDQTSAYNRITLEKFAKRVASAVCKFLDVSIS
jgi:hypothetical protein